MNLQRFLRIAKTFQLSSRGWAQIYQGFTGEPLFSAPD
jgi:hypothetical protein